METKKSIKVNLEKKRFLFLELGLVLALGVCFAAFEWATPEVKNSNLGSVGYVTTMEDDVIITRDQPPPPPPDPVKPDVVAEVINITEKPIESPNNVFNEPTGPVDIKVFKPIDPVEIIDEPLDVVEWVKVEVKPAFPGGEAALLQYISKNTKYPEIPLELGVEGKVYVEFVIGIDGKVGSVSIARGVDEHLDKEAVRVVSTLPKWTPGKQRGKNVPVSYIIPINFNIE